MSTVLKSSFKLNGNLWNIFKYRCSSTSVKLKTIPQYNEKPESVYPERIITVGKWHINYLKLGTGPHTVLCVPGPLGTIWTHLSPQIVGLDKKKFTVVALDPPGYGRSRPPSKQYKSTFYHTDAEILRDFMEALGIPKYSVLGWGDGGTSSLILAAKYPQVNKLVVWGANAFFLPHEVQFYKNSMNANLWADNMRNKMIEIYGETLYKQLLSDWIEGVSTVFRERNANVCADIIQNIKCPTLILSGKKDPLVDNLHAWHQHAHIKGSRLHIYPEGRHNIHFTYADDFNRRVQEFLLLETNHHTP